MKLLLARSAQRLAPSVEPICFKSSQIVEILDTSEDSGACLRVLLVLSLPARPNGCYGLRLNLTGYPFSFFLNGRYRNIHILISTYDERVRSPLSKQSKYEKT